MDTMHDIQRDLAYQHFVSEIREGAAVLEEMCDPAGLQDSLQDRIDTWLDGDPEAEQPTAPQCKGDARTGRVKRREEPFWDEPAP